MSSKLSILSTLLFLATLLNGQSGIQFWNTENGLSNDWVSQILQDKAGYIWIGTQYGLNRFDGYEFKNYRYDPNNEHSLSANWIHHVKQDSAGLFWVAAYLAGVNTFNPKNGVVERYELINEDTSRSVVIRSMLCAPNQSIWVGAGSGLFLKVATAKQFQKVSSLTINDLQYFQNGKVIGLTKSALYLFSESGQLLEEVATIKDFDIKRIFIDQHQVLWALGKNQLLKITRPQQEWFFELINIDDFPLTEYLFNASIYEDKQNQLWIGGQQGITVVNTVEKTAQTMPYSTVFPEGKPLGKALSFFEDNNDNMWIGTSKGLLLKSPFTKRFDLNSTIPQLVQFTSIREILQVENTLWVANYGGLFKIDLQQQDSPPKKVLSDPIFSLLLSKNGHLYAGGNRLFQIDLNTQKIKDLTATIKIKHPKARRILSMEEDWSGKIWIGAVNMLGRLNPETNQFDSFDKVQTNGLASTPTQDLLVDSKGRLWAGSLGTGLYLLEKPHEINHPKAAHFRQFTFEAGKEQSLSNKMVLYLTEGQDGAIWVATDGGLNRLHPDNFTIERFLYRDGLIDEKIMGLVADKAGYIWGSTIGHGVFRLDTNSKKFTFYNRKDGLASNNFLLSAAYRNEAGLLFFGSDNQTQLIDPQLMNQIAKPEIPFLFTELKLGVKEVALPTQNIALQYQKFIELPFDYQSFSVQYSTLNFYQADKTTYLYQLEGLHSDWQNNDKKRAITFTGLSPGDYQLKVKAVNPELNFEQETIALKIIITPPWWKTWWAYGLYLIALLSAIYGLYIFQLNRQLEKTATSRLQELDTLKNRFFTNITHELRTPLTIILGMANQLKTGTKKEVQQKAALIGRNGQQLLDLINQLLDLSKLESGKLPIQMEHGDLVTYLHYLLESFHSIAAEKDIQFHFLAEVDSLWTDYDAEKIKQLTQNLLANAIKHTPMGGHIYVQVRPIGNDFALIFRDTGKGISEAQLPHIFERFYQTDSKNYGSGIGLSLTKELVELMNGTIQVESKLGKGSTFILSLPILKNQGVTLASPYQKSNRPQPIATTFDLTILNTQKTADTPSILLIEDNEDVLYYLIYCLKENYKLVIAANGAIGIEKALTEIPDLIISDVMMPKKDGFEVCQTLKTDNKTSHIPIILLTAKADNSSKLEGLEQGADAYILKPFDQQELAVRIRKLLELRQLLQQRFQSNDFWENPTLAPTNIEDAFIIKVRQFVEENLSDSHFGIPQLCQKLGISRVHLHRKLKALTNQSTTHFIRRIRLQKAKVLLKNRDLNVSEIAYEVGFADPAYFSRLYSETFGEAPSVTRN